MKKKNLREKNLFAKPLRGVMHTEVSKFSNFVIEYLGEIETKFENTFFFLSGAWMWFRIMIKMEVKNLVTHSL